MASTNLKCSKQLTTKQVTSSISGKPALSNSSEKGKGQEAGGKKKNKKETSNKKKQKKDKAWMKVPPKDGESTTKTMDDKMCNWCIHHMSWMMHKPDEYKLGMAQAQQCSSSSTTTSQAQSLQAYLALIQQVDNLAHSSLISGWSYHKWWFRLVWHHCLHGFCAMAMTSNKNQTMLSLYLFSIPIMLKCLFLYLCTLILTIEKKTLPTSQYISLHKEYHLKYQFSYH